MYYIFNKMGGGGEITTKKDVPATYQYKPTFISRLLKTAGRGGYKTDTWQHSSISLVYTIRVNQHGWYMEVIEKNHSWPKGKGF